MRVFTGIVVVALALVSCGDDAARTEFDITDDGTTVSVPSGETITVSLEANPSTGFAWSFPVTAGVTLVEERFEEPVTTAVGAPGRTVFEFTIDEPGTFTLRLEYRRPWEPDSPAEEVFTLTVDAG